MIKIYAATEIKRWCVFCFMVYTYSCCLSTKNPRHFSTRIPYDHNAMIHKNGRDLNKYLSVTSCGGITFFLAIPHSLIFARSSGEKSISLLRF